MHKSKKIISIMMVGLFLMAMAVGCGVGQVSARTKNILTSSSGGNSYWQQFYQNVSTKVINRNPAPAPTPVTPTPVTPTPPVTPVTPVNPVTPVTPVTPTTTGKLWGAYLSDGNVSAFQTSVGKTMDMQASFNGWGDSFPSSSDKTKTQIIFWEPTNVSLSSITSGGSDSYMSQFVGQAKAYGGPVILIPFEEMNGNWDTWDGGYGSNTPAQVVAAFKHIHDVIASVGATNVKLGWDVNNDSVPDTSANSIANYWPGAAYVDYVCVDGFNFGSPWQTYSDVFSSVLSQVKGYNKPILITSTASSAGSQKSAWITDALNQIYSDPSVTGFIWFNENKEQNWLVNSDSAALQAFKTAIQQYQ